jgi:outer membrane protein, multidrug efflux system
MLSARPTGYIACLALTLLSACDLAPIYSPPNMILPAQYQGSGPFVVAHPQDQLARGPWWRVFGNTELDRLEAQLDAANPNLQAAEPIHRPGILSAKYARAFIRN